MILQMAIGHSFGVTINPAPSFVNVGTLDSGAAAISPGLPASPAANDIWIMLVQTSNQAISTPTNATAGTWAEVVAQVGTGTAASAGATRLGVYWMRWTTTTGAVTVADTGNHQIAQIAAYRGCVTSGNPWDVTSSPMGSGTWTTGNVSFPRVTTTKENCRILGCIGHSEDISNAQRCSQDATGSNLTDTGERFDATLSTGTGGGIVLADGALAGPGLIDTTGSDTAWTFALTTNPTNYIFCTIALKSNA